MKEITGKCEVNSNRFLKSINVYGKSIKRIDVLQRNSINALQM